MSNYFLNLLYLFVGWNRRINWIFDDAEVWATCWDQGWLRIRA